MALASQTSMIQYSVLKSDQAGERYGHLADLVSPPISRLAAAPVTKTTHLMTRKEEHRDAAILSRNERNTGGSGLSGGGGETGGGREGGGGKG